MNFAAPVAAQIIISVTSAVAYLLFYVGKPPSLNRTIIKTLSIAALAALAAIMDGPLLLVAALALSALGDLFISRDGEAAFLAGLGSFLLAHVAYVALFWQVVGGAAALSPVFAIAFAIYAIAILRWLWPHLAEMKAPVCAYIAVIFAMVVTATAAPLALWPIIAGAALFALSDSVLSAETFVFKDKLRRWTAPVIWSTYYASQALIAAAFICPHFSV